jgi:hypothetical protein
VTVNDPLTNGASNITLTSTLAVGASENITASYTIQQSDIQTASSKFAPATTSVYVSKMAMTRGYMNVSFTSSAAWGACRMAACDRALGQGIFLHVAPDVINQWPKADQIVEQSDRAMAEVD